MIYLSLFLFFYFSSVIRANEVEHTAPKIPNSVIISEIYPAPNSDEDEFIELYNYSSEAKTISGWEIHDTLSSPSTITIFSNETIEPFSFLTVTLSNAKLNNSGDTIKLFNENKEEIDKISYTDSESQKSIAREFSSDTQITNTISIQAPSPNERNQFQTVETPTTSPYPSQSPTPSPSSYPVIKIIEAEGCPDDSNEYVVLQNENKIQTSLDDWYLVDMQENKISLNGEIITETVQIDFVKTILNNSGDSLQLFNPNKELIDSMEVSGCKKVIEETQKNNEEKSEEIITEDQIVDSSPLPERVQQKNSELEKYNSISNSLVQNINLKTPLLEPEYIEHISSKKQVSKSGILNAIIGGTLLLISGLLL